MSPSRPSEPLFEYVPGDGPLLISFPHSGTYLPPDLAEALIRRNGIVLGARGAFPRTPDKLTRRDLLPAGTRTLNINDVGRHTLHRDSGNDLHARIFCLDRLVELRIAAIVGFLAVEIIFVADLDIAEREWRRMPVRRGEDLTLLRLVRGHGCRGGLATDRRRPNAQYGIGPPRGSGPTRRLLLYLYI